MLKSWRTSALWKPSSSMSTLRGSRLGRPYLLQHSPHLRHREGSSAGSSSELAGLPLVHGWLPHVVNAIGGLSAVLSGTRRKVPSFMSDGHECGVPLSVRNTIETAACMLTGFLIPLSCLTGLVRAVLSPGALRPLGASTSDMSWRVLTRIRLHWSTRSWGTTAMKRDILFGFRRPRVGPVGCGLLLSSAVRAHACYM